MKKLVFQVALVLLAAFTLLPARGQAVDWLRLAQGAQHLSIPRYTEPGKTLYAVVRVDKVSTEYEKRGLFHIGVLPMAVLEGFTYEIKDPAPAAQSLTQLRAWLGGEAGQHVEVRGVKFVAAPDRRLEGGSLKFIDNGHCELVGGVRLISGPSEVHAETAMLRTSGPQAGEVVLQTSPPTTNAFFSNHLSELSTAITVNITSKK